MIKVVTSLANVEFPITLLTSDSEEENLTLKEASDLIQQLALATTRVREEERKNG